MLQSEGSRIFKETKMALCSCSLILVAWAWSWWSKTLFRMWSAETPAFPEVDQQPDSAGHEQMGRTLAFRRTAFGLLKSPSRRLQ